MDKILIRPAAPLLASLILLIFGLWRGRRILNPR